MYTRTTSRVRSVSLALSLAAILTPGAAQAVSATWINGSGNYSDITKWNPILPVTPCNGGTTTFQVTIPAHSGTVSVDLSCYVDTLLLGDNSILRILTGNSYAVFGQADLYGIVHGAGGDFMALPAIFGNRARVYAERGSHISIGARSYSPTGLTGTWEWDLFKASDAGTILDLSSLQNIDDSIPPNSNDSNRHEVSATAGATLDLSGVTTITGPAAINDWLRFTVSDVGTSLDLSSLAIINNAGIGTTRFILSTDASLALPSLQSIDRVIFNLSETSSVNLGNWSVVDNSRFSATGGSQFVADTGSASYGSTGLTSNNGSYTVGTYTWNLFTASDAGTVLNLSSLQNIDAGFAQNSNDINRHEVSVSAGADLDLSGVTTITGPAALNDWLRFTVNDTNTSLGLGNLTVVDNAGIGSISFTLNTGASLSLPSMQFIDRVIFSISGASTVNVENWTTVSNSRFSATGGSQFVADKGSANYGSTGLTRNNGSYIVGTYTWNLFTASDAGTVLDLSSLQNIDAGFAQNSNDINRQEVSSVAGATLDLSGVTTITGPAANNDWLRFTVDSNGIIDLSSLVSLDSLSSANNVILDIKNGGKVLLGNVTANHTSLTLKDGGKITMGNLTAKNTSITLSGLSELETRNLDASLNTSISINESVLDINWSLQLDSSTTLTTAADAMLYIAKDYSFEHIDENKVGLESAVVRFDGNGPQFVEVGGFDIGTLTPAGTNFGFGQMIVGTDIQATTVYLRDAVDNGNGHVLCGPGEEALYLLGLPVDPLAPAKIVNGLRILGGSTLVLNGIPLYTMQDGALVDVRTWFPPGHMVIAYALNNSNGFIALGSSPDTDADNDGVIDANDNCVFVANADQCDTIADG